MIIVYSVSENIEENFTDKNKQKTRHILKATETDSCRQTLTWRMVDRSRNNAVRIIV